MNDDFDSLESELAGLAPVCPSPQLRDRLAKELTAAVLAERKRSWRLPLVVAAALSLAASLLVIFWSRNSMNTVAPAWETGAPSLQAFDPSVPSVWSYHRALAESNDALDSLLNRHAAARSSDEPLSHAAAFRSFISTDPDDLGEL